MYFAVSDAVADGRVFFARAYFYIPSVPDADLAILAFGSKGGGTDEISIRLTTSMQLQMYDEFNGVQLGTISSPVLTNTWLRLELKADYTVDTAVVSEAKVDGNTFATGTSNQGRGAANLTFGFVTTGGSHTYALYVDDVAINDNTGTVQNSWPGDGSIVHLQPNAAGDNNAWTRGGTDSGANWSQENEVTPNDDTNYVSSNTAGQIDDYNLTNTPASIGNGQTINVVQVGARLAGAGASANASFVTRLKASSGGTVSESSAITPAGTSWTTNAAADPFVYPLTSSTQPGTGTAWTKATLDTAQVGIRLSGAATNAAQVSTLWLLVDSSPLLINEQGIEIQGVKIIG